MSVKSVNEMNIGVKPMMTKGAFSQAVAETPIKPKLKIPETKVAHVGSTVPLKEEITPKDEKGQVLGSDWIRVDLLSNFVPYEWSDFSIRAFKPRDQAKLATAVKYKNMSLLLDVISSTSTKDARELTFLDWKALCILHKRHSYLDTPYNITWNSRYGVVATNTTKIIKMEEKHLKATRKDYLEWKEKHSLVMPTCKDVEVISANIDEETLYLFNKAQYIDPEPLKDRIEELRKNGDLLPTVTARIEKLDELGISHFNLIDEYDEIFSDFGISEKAVVEVSDRDFNAEIAIGALRNFKSNLEDSVAANKEVEEAAKEADLIEKMYNKAKEETGEGQPVIVKYKPRKEEVPLAFSPWTMFPHT